MLSIQKQRSPHREEEACLAERIRQAVEESSITYAGRALRCTVSVGVVVWCGEGDGESPEALIARSDDALYAAKHGGRNRVCAGADPG